VDATKAKSFWRGRASEAWSFICPLCSSPRKLAQQPRPTPTHYAQIGLTAAIFTLITWHWFEWKGIISFLPMWTVFEVIYRARVRAAMRCTQCGFDPYLYLVDVKRARTDIESHWRKKFAEKNIPYPEKPQPTEPEEPPSAGILLASSVKKPSHPLDRR
jgi:hypothetical protein